MTATPSPSRRRPSIVEAAALILGPFVIGGAFAIAACTPAVRQEAATVVSTLGPVACELAALLAPDGSPAGLVCADVAKALSAGLLLARVDAPATALPAAARSSGCTPVPLRSADPGRDAREYVCAEAFGGEGAARLAVLQALATGHAR